MGRLLDLIHARRQAGSQGVGKALAGLNFEEQKFLLALCESVDEGDPAERLRREQAAEVLFEARNVREHNISLAIERWAELDRAGYFANASV